MAVSTLHRMLDIARPLEAQRRQPHGLFAGSALSQPRETMVPPPVSRGSLLRWLRAAASPRGRSRRDSIASPFLLDGADGDAFTYPARMVALGRVVARVVESQR